MKDTTKRRYAVCRTAPIYAVSALLSALIMLTGCAGSHSGEVGYTSDVSHGSETSAPLENETSDVEQGADVELPEGFGGVSVLRFGSLPSARAVQQFAFYEENGEEYIFVTQREGSTVYLSRCKVNSALGLAVTLDYAVLEGYGHGDSLDISIHNGHTYVLIASGANTSNDNAWSTQLTRLRYESGSITDVKVLTDMSRATKDGSQVHENATTYRINFGADDSSDMLAIYIKADTDNNGKVTGNHYINAYRLSAVHEALDRAETDASLGELYGALIATTGQTSSGSICKNGSCQGVEVGANGEILITGGTTSKKPELYIFELSDGVISRKEIREISFIASKYLGTKDFSVSEKYVEIESIKYLDGDLYCVFNPGGDMERDHTELYLLTEGNTQVR